MNYRNILFGTLGIGVILLIGFFLGVNKTLINWKNVHIQLLSIAEKSYFIGCFEQRGQNCHKLSEIYREVLRERIGSVREVK